MTDLVYFFDFAFIVGIISLMKISLDATTLAIVILPIPYVILTKRKRLLAYLAVAFFMGIAWGTSASAFYSYDSQVFVIGHFNFYPVLFWSAGLFGAQLVFNMFQPRLRTFWTRFLCFILIFWSGLILVEFMAYHVFQIHNLATSKYAGLPGLDCIHAPTWMKLAYFSIGPLYFLIVEALKKEVENTRLSFGLKILWEFWSPPNGGDTNQRNCKEKQVVCLSKEGAIRCKTQGNAQVFLPAQLGQHGEG